jgi:hypothetical protein
MMTFLTRAKKLNLNFFSAFLLYLLRSGVKINIAMSVYFILSRELREHSEVHEAGSMIIEYDLIRIHTRV